MEAKSIEKFYENVSNLFFTNVDKWNRVRERVIKRRIIEERKEKVKEDCKKILQACKKKGKITLSEIKQICKLPESTLYFRVNLLVYNGNLKKKRIGKINEYALTYKRLSILPTINEMRRKFRWR